MTNSVEELLEKIVGVNQKPAKKFWNDLVLYLPASAGSTKSHHAWDYGYRHHVQEVMNLAILLYDSLNAKRKLDFDLSSALLVLFLHDCEKPFRHATDEELAHFPWIRKRPLKSDKKFQARLIEQYGFHISDQEQNGLWYVEGEHGDYREGVRTQLPLAAFCHVCDTISARIWFNYPLENERC